MANEKDHLDRHYTPDPVADIIVARLAETMRTTPRTMLEPSVGGGAFVRAARRRWPGIHVHGIDVDRDAPGFRECDVSIVRTFESDNSDLLVPMDLVLGNGPFSARTVADFQRCRDHVTTALELPGSPMVCLILPWAFLGGVQKWADVLDVDATRPSDAWPIAPRPWGNRVREVAACVWLETAPTFTRLRPLPRWR